MRKWGVAQSAQSAQNESARRTSDVSAVSRKKRENHFPFTPARRHRRVVPLGGDQVCYYLQTVRTLTPSQVGSNAPSITCGVGNKFPIYPQCGNVYPKSLCRFAIASR